jgi:hypothetical protein
MTKVKTKDNSIDMTKMVRIDVSVPEDLDNRFRMAIVKAYGMKRGNIQKVLMTIIEQWIKKVDVEYERKDAHKTQKLSMNAPAHNKQESTTNEPTQKEQESPTNDNPPQT